MFYLFIYHLISTSIQIMPNLSRQLDYWYFKSEVFEIGQNVIEPVCLLWAERGCSGVTLWQKNRKLLQPCEQQKRDVSFIRTEHFLLGNKGAKDDAISFSLHLTGFGKDLVKQWGMLQPSEVSCLTLTLAPIESFALLLTRQLPKWIWNISCEHIINFFHFSVWWVWVSLV